VLRRALAALLLLCSWAPEAWCQQIDMAAVEAADAFQTGVRAFHRGAYQSAMLAFERSLALKPEDNQVKSWLGSASFRAGYVDAATRIWRDLTRTDYDAAVIRNRLQYATWRYGLGAELAATPTWVVAYEIRSQRGDVSAFKRPVSVRTRRDGSLAVVAFAGNQISILDVNGSVLDTLRGGLYGLDRPFDVIEVPGGLVVSEFGGRIVKCTPAGQRTLEFGGKQAPRLLSPQFLAADAKGYIYVTDWGSGRVHKYDAGGSYILSFSAGLEEPTGILVSGGEVYVADRKAGRVSVFDESGNLLRTIGEGRLVAPEGLALWEDGTLLVAEKTRLMAGDIATDAWAEWGNLGSLARRMTSVAVDTGGAIYVSDMDAEKIYVLTRQPNLIAGNNVWIGKISSDQYPKVTLEVSVTDRFGRPLTGLRKQNFLLYEASAPLASFDLARAPVDPAELDVVVVVDQSPETEGSAEAIRSTVLSLYDELARASRLSFVGGEVPTVVALPGMSRLRTAEAVLQSKASARFRIDAAIRVAANELGSSWGRKAIVYLTAGGIGKRAFEATSLTECAAALANNDVSFSVVWYGAGALADELSYLVRFTGGQVVGAASPRGLAGLAADLSGAVSPVYLLTYSSATFPDFGRRYLSVRVEVVLPGTSGGDVSGYFAPVEK
jgi:DNA-binding beta-propeller fold protein YncE